MKDFFEKGLTSLRSKPSSSNAQLACQQLKNFLSQSCDSAVAKLKKKIQDRTRIQLRRRYRSFNTSLIWPLFNKQKDS